MNGESLRLKFYVVNPMYLNWSFIFCMIYLWMIYVLLKHEESDVKAWELDSFSFLMIRNYWYVIIITVVYL